LSKTSASSRHRLAPGRAGFEAKTAYSAFEGATEDGGRLSDWLREREIDQVDICGIATDYCVRATALDAVREGFQTKVLLSLTAAVAPERVPEITTELTAAGVTVSRSA